jgi:hypothetical protein
MVIDSGVPRSWTKCIIMEVLCELIPMLNEARRHPDLEFH